jgi:hypothetical protein
MRLSVKLFALGTVGIVVLLVGLMRGWLGGKNEPAIVQPETVATTPETPPATFPDTPRPSRKPEGAPLLPVRNATGVPTANITPTNSQPWDRQIDDILGSEADTALKAKQFVALIPQLSAEAQVEAAEHAANLMPDDQYAELGKILVDPKTPETVLDVLLGDLLDRPNTIKLPLLLQVMRTPEHPSRDEAREDLVFYLDEDFGNDWAVWEQKLGVWLKENPEE